MRGWSRPVLTGDGDTTIPILLWRRRTKPTEKRSMCKICGSVSDVNAAMEVALETAKPLGKIVSHTVIASPSADTEVALKMTINK